MLPRLLVACLLLGSSPSVSATAADAAPRQATPGPQAKAPAEGGNAYYYFVMGRHLESDGDVDGAVKAYRQALALDPRSAEIPAELASLYARQNRPRDAIEWAGTALKIDVDNAEANRVLGIVYASLARLDDESAGASDETLDYAKRAIRHLETARQHLVSPDASLDLMLGRLYLRTGENEQAIAALRRLVDQDADRGEPIALLAQAYEQAGRPDDALAVMQGAVGEHPEFYASLGELYERQGKWKEATGAYERALARNPRRLDVKTRLAIALLSQGGPAAAGRAAEILQEAKQQSPADTQVLYLLAQAQRVAGKLDDAETTARQLVALAPSSLSGSYALAQVYEEKQQYRRVVELLEPVVQRAKPGGDAEIVSLSLSLASAYEELGAFDRALGAFERVRALAPSNRSVDVYELGVLVSARRYGQALDRSAHLLASASDDQRIARLRAEALRGAGRKDEAVTLLKEQVTRHPGDVTAYLALSELHAAISQFDAALRVLDEAAKKFPSDVTVRFQRGSVLDRQKRFDDAERVFRSVLSEDPLYAPALNYLGYMLADRGERLDESIAFIKRALAVEPYNGAYLDSLGWAYFKANRLQLAEESLRKAADQRLRDSAVQDHFGDLLFKLGRYREAIGAWRKALDGDGEQVSRDAIEQKIRSASEKVAKQ